MTAAKFHAYKQVAVADLTAADRNPRTHSKTQIAQLVKSIRRFGFTNPVLIDESGQLIAGHGRLEAAKVEGLTHVPAIEVAGLTASDKRALLIADNQLALNAAWDVELLGVELASLEGEGFDTDLLGFSDEQLAELIAPGTRGNTDPDVVPPLPKEPTAQPGELYALGRHRLLCGDSFNAEDRKRLLDGTLVDLVLTDPPYAIYGSSSGIGSDIADDKMVRPFFEKLGRVCLESVREFAHIYVHCDWRSYATLWDGFKVARLSPKNCIVWDKGGAGLGSSYANTHEFVAFFARLPKQKAMTSGAKRGQRMVHHANIYRVNRVRGDERQHNAAKPVELLVSLIENSTDAGGLVLDLFNGSGSTLLACEKAGRSCFAMEMEARYIDVTIDRWQQFTGQKAERLE